MAISKETEISILEVSKGIVEVCILGVSPMICNRMSEKARQELLFPNGRKTIADRSSMLKHDPWKEYRSSPYTNLLSGPTRLQVLASMFKKAMMTAALDLPGAKKAQVGRLVYVMNDRIDLYGTPQIMTSVTRSSDINHTPDVRTRAILPRWACKLRIAYVKPIVNETSVVNLLAAAGITAGIGDWRVEKGSGNYGQFELTQPTNKDFLSIIKEGRKDQDAALKDPTAYDDESRDLLEWFNVEVSKRGKKQQLAEVANAA